MTDSTTLIARAIAAHMRSTGDPTPVEGEVIQRPNARYVVLRREGSIIQIFREEQGQLRRLSKKKLPWKNSGE